MTIRPLCGVNVKDPQPCANMGITSRFASLVKQRARLTSWAKPSTCGWLLSLWLVKPTGRCQDERARCRFPSHRTGPSCYLLFMA
jgi:hypothetical protein